MPEMDLTLQLFGAPRLRGKLRSWATVEGDPELLAELQASLTEVGDIYLEKVKQVFADRHGQTGDTEESFEGRPAIGGGQASYVIHIGGNIGYVLNPLPEHYEEARSAGALYDANPEGPALGRGRNFYSPLPMTDNLLWYQGGEESYNPDPRFYEGANGDLLFAANTEAHKLANVIQVGWQQAVAGEAELARGNAIIQWREAQYGH